MAAPAIVSDSAAVAIAKRSFIIETLPFVAVFISLFIELPRQHNTLKMTEWSD
tara:strand:- start:255 stop:413 length:159 start_codon:yes stop_codon:yes gene_type:complete